jgi:transposase-like protein
MRIIRKNSRFIICWQGFSVEFPDIRSNRKVAVVFLRYMRDSNGKSLFTFDELSEIVSSGNRQASSQHVEDFRESGEDFKGLLLRKRKVDEEVVEAVAMELRRDPLVEMGDLQRRVSERLSRDDLSARNIDTALDQISYKELRGVVRRQFSKGEAHYNEEYLLEEMMEGLSCESGRRAGLGKVTEEGMFLSDPSAIRKLITPGIGLSEIPRSLHFVVMSLSLYYWGIPLSRLGVWLGVHKTTVLRWMLGLVLMLWPTVSDWIVSKVRLGVVYIDEKWIKIRGVWYYWFVAMDSESEIPVCQILSKSRSKWVCRWIGICLSRLKGNLKAICTDGLPGYRQVALQLGVVHLLCHFHYQRGIICWLKKHFSKEEAIDERKAKMKRIFQTKDKRTAKRRLGKLSQSAKQLGIAGWIDQMDTSLPSLLPSVGSRIFPTTTNAIERFFRTFNRFYKVRCGFHSFASAKRELLLFLLVYMFTTRQKDGLAPIESIFPKASKMPLYRLINDPFLVLGGVSNVKLETDMADKTTADLLAA